MNTDVIIHTLHCFGEPSITRIDIVHVHHVFVANRLTGVEMGIFIGENDYTCSKFFYFTRVYSVHLCLKIYAWKNKF